MTDMLGNIERPESLGSQQHLESHILFMGDFWERELGKREGREKERKT